MITTETTPNPNSLKFLSEKTISEAGTEEFQKKDLNEIKNNFVKNLLNLKGVELILLSDNFLSVKKTKEISWEVLKPTVISHINDYFQKNDKPILTKKTTKQEKNIDSNNVEERIIKVLDSKIRPAVARDGGDIKFKSFKNGVVHVELQGSCSGCPSSLMTLKQGVQNLLCHYVEEVKSVEAI
ncbi:MAG: NifU family protein [Pelagibacteraceae bacterium]|jgi:NFU1 iron-sulfur cluster scaffold homolog, mitochondrial|nr:NifU family protein [Pelagibacteraceae bacterium]